MAVEDVGKLIDGLAHGWAKRAVKAKPLVPNLPLHTFAAEGFELALFIERFWNAPPGLGCPGLEAVARPGFDLATAGEIRELSLALLHLEAEVKASYAAPERAPVERARHVLEEVLAGLAFLFHRKQRASDAAVLKNVRQHLTVGSHDGLALGLETVAELARRHRRELLTLPGVDEGILAELSTLAQALWQHSAVKASRDAAPRQLRDARARVARLLLERVTAARAAIRFCFRAHPELVKRATSEYTRQRRASQRAAKQKG